MKKTIFAWAAIFLVLPLLAAFAGFHSSGSVHDVQMTIGLGGMLLAGVVDAGTHDITSLLAVTQQTVVDFGEDTIAAVIAADNANYNALVQQALVDLVETTTERQLLAGTSIGGDMLESEEYARIMAQKQTAGQLQGFPFRMFQFAVGWTRKYLKEATPRDLVLKNQAAQGADLRRLQYELKKSIFTPTNYTFVDALKDRASLGVKALINADSSAIQNGPNGETFDGTTHSHYNASATLTAAAVQATIDDVMEHGAKGCRIFINLANEAAFKALTGFLAYMDPRVSIDVTTPTPTNSRLDITVMNNRPIGIFGAAEVWVKPWIPANYLLVSEVNGTVKPVAMRVETTNLGLHVEATIDVYPLTAEFVEHTYGFAVYNRLAAAVLEFDNASYSAPALTFAA